MDVSVQLQAIAALIALAFLYKLFKATAKGKKSGPPEPKGSLPIFGHLHMLGGDVPLTRKLGSLADKYGPAFIIRLGTRPALVISSWELTKESFTTNDKALAGRPKFEVGTLMAYNNAALGFAPYGAYWRDMRKFTVLELLSARRLDTLKQVRATEVHLIMKDLHGLWEKNSKKPLQVEMGERFGDITFNVIAMMVIGKRCFGSLSDNDNGDSGRFRHATEEWFHLFGAFVPSDVFPFLKWWDLKGYKKEMRRVFHTLDSLLSKWLEEHRRKKMSGETVGEQDFLDVLISHIDGSQFTDYDVDTMIKATALGASLYGFSHREIVGIRNFFVGTSRSLKGVAAIFFVGRQSAIGKKARLHASQPTFKPTNQRTADATSQSPARASESAHPCTPQRHTCGCKNAPYEPHIRRRHLDRNKSPDFFSSG